MRSVKLWVTSSGLIMFACESIDDERDVRESACVHILLGIVIKYVIVAFVF